VEAPLGRGECVDRGCHESILSKLRPYSVDLDLDFTQTNGFVDLGDVDVEYMSYDKTFARTEHAVAELLKRGGIPMISGGSHSISEATLRAFSRHYNKNVGVVWFDGHPDFMKSYKGDEHYCGCPMWQLVNGGYVKPENIVFLGLRGFANASAEIKDAKEMGVTFYTMEQFYDRRWPSSFTQCILVSTRLRRW
jgi:arginase family enzyme